MTKLKIFVGILLATFFCEVQAQCKSEYLDSCKKHLKEDHYTFIKQYNINNESGKKQKIEYSYVLSKGKSYEFYFEGYSEEGQDVIATLYNIEHNEVASSFHHNKYEHKLEYNCSITGVYYVVFTFKDSEHQFCGVAGLGFSSTKTESK